jgi:O-methyltransferase involved in polyketide biosynthesis
VDVPDAIRVRDRFLPPSPRCRHVPKSVLDLTWLDDVEPSRDVFVTAQGLLMYFVEDDVRRLFCAIVDRFPGVELMFDTIPRWFSKKTLKGYRRTPRYTAPPMPWGVGRDELDPLLRRWSPRIASVTTQPYGYARGIGLTLVHLCERVSWLRNISPAIAHVTTTRERTSARC